MEGEENCEGSAPITRSSISLPVYEEKTGHSLGTELSPVNAIAKLPQHRAEKGFSAHRSALEPACNGLALLSLLIAAAPIVDSPRHRV